MPSYAELLEKAAFETLLAPGEAENSKRPNGQYPSRYSCNAVFFAEGKKSTEQTVAALDWYYNTILCADRSVFPAAAISIDCEDPQNVRFMLLLFAAYFAADEGL